MTSTGPVLTDDPRDAYFDTSALTRDIGRQAGAASIIILLVSVLKIGQQFIGLAILARLIPPSEYGIFALTIPIVTLALALSNFGLPQAIIQRAKIGHSEVTTLFWINVGFATMAAGLVAACSGWVAKIYDQPQLSPVFATVAISIVFSAVAGQYAAILRRRLRVRQSELMQLAGELGGLVVAIIGAAAGLSYWALVLQQIVSPLLSMILMASVCGWRPSGPRHVNIKEARASLSFGGFVAGQAILVRLSRYAGTMIVGAVVDATAAGLFMRARQLAEIPARRVMTPLAGAFIPAMSRLQDDPKAQCEMYVRLISRSNVIVMPVAVMMAAGADPAVRVLLGPTWIETAPLLFWMSLFILRNGANAGLHYMLMACGQSRALFVNSFIRLVLVSVTVWYTARFGLVAMTAANMLVELLITLPMMLERALRHTPLTMRYVARASLVDMLLAIVLAGLLILFVNPAIDALPDLVELIILGLLTATAYGVRIVLSPDFRRDALGVIDRIGGRFLRRGA